MPSLKPLAKEVNQAVKRELRRSGFRYRQHAFIKQISPATVGEVLVQTKSYVEEQVVLLHTNVGVYNAPIQELVDEWSGQDTKYHMTPTALEPLYELSDRPGYFDWQFTPACNIEEIVSDLVYQVLLFGVPFMERLSTTDAMLDYLLVHGCVAPEHTRYAIPAAYWVLGRKEEARRYVKKVIDELANDTNDRYREETVQKYAEVMLKI